MALVTLFAACNRDNEDMTMTDPNENPNDTTMVNCDSFMVNINSILHPAGYNLTANAGGGTAPYLFAWSNGDTTQTIFFNSTDDASVAVTDANGCVVHDTISNTCTNFGVYIGTDSINQNILYASASGGTPPYQYSWNTGATTSSVPLDAAVLEYQITVTDANGCLTDAVYANTSDPCDGFSAYIGLDPNDPTVLITLTANGTPPYTYQWNRGATTSSVPFVPRSGDYLVVVTDANGCMFTSIYSNPVCDLQVFIHPDSIINNQLVAAAAGWSAPYTYLWSDGSTGASIPLTPNTSNYTVTVVDNSGCTAVDTYTSSADCIDLNFSISYDGTSELMTHMHGGTAPFTYNWATGETTNNITIANDSLYYVLTVTDANGCTLDNYFQLQ